MAQIFRPGANSLFRIVLGAIVLSPILLLIASAAFPRTDYATGVDMFVDQPVPFSHKHHAGDLGLDCRYCHTGVESSAVAGLPPTETCMTCHSQIWTNAAMLAPVRLSLAENKPLRWNAVNTLPDYVYFDHSVHIAAGVGCSTCHGDVDKMPLMMKAKPLTMEWCLNCHREPERYLRPRNQIFNMNWAPPPNQLAIGRKLLAKRKIEKTHLTNCSVCHR